MAEKHLALAIRRRFKRLPAAKRIEKIRSLANESKESKEFIRTGFPELYREAFSHPQLLTGGSTALPV